MQQTSNLKLNKIELTDAPDITVINPNWDKLDTEVQSLKTSKVDKESGKGLSTNDYTSAEKSKLAGVAPNANNYVHPNDANNRHVSDTEKSTWNAKETPSGAQSKADKALNDAKAYTNQQVADIVNTAPEALDTLKELSDALGNDPNFSTTVMTEIGKKVDKVSGKGLSENDYTTAEKNKLAGVATGANNYVHPSTSGNKHIPSGGRADEVLKWSADGTAVWSEVGGAILQEGTTVRINNPKGASYDSRVHPQTGAIKITLPQSWTSTMMKMKIEIYNYMTNESLTVLCSGYNYQSNPSWNATTAQIISSTTSKDLAVRFGHDGTKCCIIIGEINSTWSYPIVTVTEFVGGFQNATSDKWKAGWSIGVITTLPTAITATHTNNLIASDFNKLKNKTNATSSADGLMAKGDKSKLDGIATGANNYSHPANHPPSIITQDASNRFVTDADKSNWNGKLDKTGGALTGSISIDSTGTSYNEGVRINKGSNSWCGVILGGAKGSSSGTGVGIWGIHNNPSGNLVLSHNGSPDNNGLALYQNGDIKWKGNSVFHAGNKPTASDVGAVSRKYMAGYSSYEDVAIPLCEITNTNISLNSFTNGTLYCKRNNGLSGMNVSFEIMCSKKYNEEKPSYVVRADNGYSISLWKMCIFTYNSKKYFGIRTVGMTAEYTQYIFNGETTEYNVLSPIKYKNNSTGAILNTEINNSIVEITDNIGECGDTHLGKNTFIRDYATGTSKRVSVEGHEHTKNQVGLSNVDNTSDLAKPISTATQNALNGKANSSHGNHVPTTETADARKFLRNDNTWQTLPTGTTNATGIVQLNDAVNSTSTTQASTANATKKVQDGVNSHTTNTTVHITSAERTNWNGKVNKSGDTMTGNLNITGDATPLGITRNGSPNLNICFNNVTSGNVGTRYFGTYQGTSLRFGANADLSSAYEVYHTGRKPTPAEIGAESVFTKNTAFNKSFGTGAGQVAEGNHGHSYLPLSGGTLTGNLLMNSSTAKIQLGTSASTTIGVENSYDITAKTISDIILWADTDSGANVEYVQMKTGNTGSNGLKVFGNRIEANEKLQVKKEIEIGSTGQVQMKYNSTTESLDFVFV